MDNKMRKREKGNRTFLDLMLISGKTKNYHPSKGQGRTLLMKAPFPVHPPPSAPFVSSNQVSLVSVKGQPDP